MKNILTICSTLVIFAATNLVNAQWQQTNGPYGGFVSCYANNADEIYVGTQFGGIFRSTNDGASWTAKNNGLKNYEINCLAIDGEDLYAGTNLGGYDGVYHTNNGGNTWTPIPNLWTSYVSYCIAASGEDIYVGTAGGGNFFSHDGGQSWNSSIAGIVPYQYHFTNQILLLEDKLLTIVNGLLYQSVDGGVSYNQVESGFLVSTYCGKLSVAGPNIFATTTTGLYISTDSGINWQNISAEVPIMPNGMLITTSENFVYITDVAGEEIYYANYNGYDWSPLYTEWGTVTSSFHAIADGELLVQSSYYSLDYSLLDSPQLHFSGNNGDTWEDVTNEITSTYCMSLTAHGNNVYVGTWGNGICKTSNQGETWEFTPNLNSWSLPTMATFGNTIFAAGDGGILRSVDDGSIWTVCNQGLQSTGILGFAQIGADIFAATPMGVVISTDDGQTWSASNSGMGNEYATDIISIGNTLYAVSQSGIYKSVNFGNSWSEINNDFPQDYIPTKIGHIGEVLFVSGGNSGTMYKSSNNGDSWISMNFDFIGYPSSFAVYDDLLFVGAFGNLNTPGVFMTNDLGTNWTDVSEGLDNNLVWDIIINNGWAYVCTKGSGVYKRPLADFLPENISSAGSHEISIYPNPSRDIINFKGNGVNMTKAQIKIFDSKGSLILSKKLQGSSLNISTLPFGFYSIEIMNDDSRSVLHFMKE